MGCASLQAVDASPALRVLGIDKELYVKIASERWEWEQAFALVSANYRARGYLVAEGDELYFTSYHALPQTIVVVAEHEHRVVATFTVVMDNHLLGLPLERLFPEEIASLRQGGHRIGEVTSLADRDLAWLDFVLVFRAMMKLGAQWGARQGGDTTVIAVHPRHRSFYMRVLGFLPLGPCRPYGEVQGAPAEALWVNWEQMKTRKRLIYQELIATALSSELLTAAPMPRALIREFDRRSVSPSGPLLTQILRQVNAGGNLCRW